VIGCIIGNLSLVATLIAVTQPLPLQLCLRHLELKMSDDRIRRDGSALTPNEFAILINVHRYISGRGPAHNQHKALNSRRLLALVTGVGENAAQEAIRLDRQNELPSSVARLGRPRKKLHPEYAAAVRSLVLQGNRSGTPVTTSLLRETLLQEYQFSISPATLRRDLHRLGYHFGRGNRHNVLHDSQANVDYRNLYVERRLANLNSNGRPIIPEVFLDESYCHLDHHARKTWVESGGVVNERGRLAMLVIFGAFVVFRQDNRVCANFVRDNILVWPVSGGLRGATATGRGRRAAGAELWREVPAVVREAGIAPDFHDYHGNFNAELFERLFEKLCVILHDDYGSCNIHMDGAKYHVRQENPLPSTANRVEAIRAWFEREHVPLPPGSRPGKAPTKAEMIEHVKSLNHPVRIATYEIASKHGHKIMKTPPYHCELQPIEQVWGVVKNQVAARPNLNETELSLRNRLLRLFVEVPQSTLISVWKKSVKNNQDYFALYEAGSSQDEEGDNEDVGDSDESADSGDSGDSRESWASTEVGEEED
jgi:transposase